MCVCSPRESFHEIWQIPRAYEKRQGPVFFNKKINWNFNRNPKWKEEPFSKKFFNFLAWKTDLSIFTTRVQTLREDPFTVVLIQNGNDILLSNNNNHNKKKTVNGKEGYWQNERVPGEKRQPRHYHCRHQCRSRAKVVGYIIYIRRRFDDDG